jgi:hypothetical protein
MSNLQIESHTSFMHCVTDVEFLLFLEMPVWGFGHKVGKYRVQSKI